MNATEECYTADRRAVIQRYNSLAQQIVPQCRAQAAATVFCYSNFNQGMDALANFDTMAVSHVVENVVQQVVTMRIFGNQQNSSEDMMYMGVHLPAFYNSGLPGDYQGMNMTTGNGTWQNPYIRHRRDAHRGSPESGRNATGGNRNGTNDGGPGSGFWSDNSTSGSTNSTGSGGQGGNMSQPDGGLPTDLAPEMAQSGGQGMDWLDRLSALLYSQMSHAEYIDTLSGLANLSRYDIAALTQPQALAQIGRHKMDLCRHVHQAYSCLQLNLQMMMMPGSQQYLMSTALSHLGDVAMEMCAGRQLSPQPIPI